MTAPKIKDCPKCDAPGDCLAVYTYDSGWRHVECDGCYYLGPGAGNIVQAIRLHNARVSARAAKQPTGSEQL